MKILILSASIGSGHMRAADAIARAFDSIGSTVEVIDFMSADVSRFNQLLKRLYLAALSMIPDLYDRIYRLAGRRRAGPLTRLLWSTLMYLPFNRLLKERRPDVIICTHPFPEAAAALWKFLHVKSAGKFLLAAVLTDYSLHEIWLYGEVDVYFVATSSMKQELSQHSRLRQKIFSTGIPIDLGFEGVRRSARGRSILIMGGGLGLGSIERTLVELESIERRLEITVVAGRNDNLVGRLKTFRSKHALEVLGYVSNVRELMERSTLLITKPGALTMTEAFAVGLPLLLHAPIPGPEALNAEYAVSNGAAISLGGSDGSMALVLEELLDDRARLDAMSTSALRLSRASAATEIVARLMTLTH